MDLSTVIVHYRALDTLPGCLAALEAAAASLAHETVVVDNDAEAGLVERLARDFPEVGCWSTRSTSDSRGA